MSEIKENFARWAVLTYFLVFSELFFFILYNNGNIIRYFLLNLAGLIINRYSNIFLLFFITGCAGFYTKSELRPQFQLLKADELNVLIEMSFTHRDVDHVVDEIEIDTNPQLRDRVNILKDSIINSLRESNPNKKINYLNNKKSISIKKECILKINIDEALSPMKGLPTALTLGIWPYIDTRVISIKSILMKDETNLSESNTSHEFTAAMSIFLIPLAPFMSIQKAEREIWIDAYKENLSKIAFNKCE